MHDPTGNSLLLVVVALFAAVPIDQNGGVSGRFYCSILLSTKGLEKYN